MDLMNLPKVLAEGVRIPREDGRIVLITPLGRGDFVRLDKPVGTKDAPDRKAWRIRMLWNWGNADQPALVNLKAIVAPAIKEIADLNRVDPQGVIRKGTERKQQKEDGTWRDGYGPGIGFVSINRQASNDDVTPPVVRDSRKAVVDPRTFKAGFYGRCVTSLYYVPYGGGKICWGLEEVQLIARGPLLAGGGGGIDYSDALGEVQGDDFSSEPVSSTGPTTPSDDQMFGGPVVPGDDDEIPF